MLSNFKSVVQDRLQCRNGFDTVRECLERENEMTLNNRFAVFVHAINVLKRGRGRSYDALVTMDNDLPFRIKRPGEVFFSEGDIY